MTTTNRTLELCCGTKSFSKVCETLGYNTVTVDNNPLFEPTHICDILDFDYKTLYPDKTHFKLIWASPPCTNYSNAKRFGIRDLTTADKLVKKCLEIIEYYDCDLWFLENPYTGYLKSRDFMINRPYHRVDYCAYDDNLGMKKATAIWTNSVTFQPKVCRKKGECPNMVDNKHYGTATGSYFPWKNKKQKAISMGQIPKKLIIDLIHSK